MSQKSIEETSETFPEFSIVYSKQVNDNDKQSGTTSLGQLLSVLDTDEVNDSEKYQVIFTEYGDNYNAAVTNCDNEIDAEIYTIHIEETEDGVCDSKVTLVKEKPKRSNENKLLVETLPSKEPSLLTDNDTTKGQEASPSSSEAAEKTTSVTLRNLEDKGNCTSTVTHECDRGVQEEEEEEDEEEEEEEDEEEEEERTINRKKIYLEINEQNVFALHGLDVSLPITCDVCDTDFDDMSEFDDHMRSHLDFKFFMCQLCTKSYRSWQNLVAHRQVCHDGLFISCKHCKNRKGHHKLGPVNFPVEDASIGCEECYKGFKNTSELNRHYRCHAESGRKMESEQCEVSSDVHKKHKEDVNVNAVAQEEDEVPSAQSGNSMINLKCDMSQKETLSLKSFKEHKKLQSGIAVKFKCPICSKVFKNMAVYENHKLLHVGETMYKCKVCFKKFKSKESLNVHEYSHPSRDKCRCFNCQMNFSGIDDLVGHIMSIHLQNPEMKLICDICLTNHSVDKFLSHYLKCRNSEKPQETALEESEVICQVCDKKLRSPEALYRHLQIHRSSKQCLLCDVCGELIQDMESFISHVRSHREGSKTSLSKLKGTLKENISNNKSDGQLKSIRCEMCCWTFKTRKDLQRHVRLHTGEKPYGCNSCHLAFYSRKQLSLHMRQHTGQFPYRCGVCNKSFMSNRALHSHKETHKGSKRLGCPICNRKFRKRSACRSHIQTHSGIQLHKCDDCPKTFLFKYNLTVHKKIHQNEKLKLLSHQCSDCGQSFATAMELQNHHEEKCYLTMITFMPSGSNANKESSS